MKMTEYENVGQKEQGEKKDLVQYIKDKKGKIYEIEDDDKLDDAMQKISDFTKKLKKEYPDYENNILYHTLAGSIPRPEDLSTMEKKDFPGEFCIVNFIDNLYAVYVENKKIGRL